MSAAERAPLSAPSDAVIKRGYLKKLKTMKKKYFVLRGETPENSARLEYYDSEKKWKTHGQPKKVVPLKSCFNITRRLDTRQKHVIAMYTREEVLCMVAEGEDDLAGWLATLLEVLHPGAGQENLPHPRQHIWQVNVQKKGLGASRNILGLYNLCLTDKTLSLVKIRPNTKYVVPHDMRAADTIEYSLTSIRRCGDSECFFYMEVGRSSVTGAGELWMHTEDPNIAQSMHATILHAMSNSANIKEELGPKSRLRSSSANEGSKPISVLARRQTHTGTKSHGLSPSSGAARYQPDPTRNRLRLKRQCDRPGVGHSDEGVASTSFAAKESALCSGRSCVGLCISPCENASAAYCAPQQPLPEDTEETLPPEEASDASGSQQGGRSSEGAAPGVVHERTRSLPLTGDERACAPRPADRASPPEAPKGLTNGCKRWQKAFASSRRASTGCRLGKSPVPPSQFPLGALQVGGVRERCDSLPSNGRAGSAVGVGASGAPVGGHRPHSMYTRGLSHSPPTAIANSSLSPHSGAYSTDSAGSSISIDEPDSFMHHPMLMDDSSHNIIGRLINSRTPDERSIPEEAGDDPLCLWQPEKCLSESVEKSSYNQKSLSQSLERSSFTTFGGGLASGNSIRKSSVGGMPEMSSPMPITGTSPQDSAGYMPMSPASSEPTRMTNSRTGCNSSNHSRTSSLAEEVPESGLMLLKTDDGYVDMEPSKEGTQTMSPAASTCSVTSGTPSTDLRFSEFHLEKVTSYFTLSEEDEENRPARAYSVGSRPEHIKKILNRPDSHLTSDSARTRAFSVGSRSKTHKDNRILNHSTPPHCHLQHLMGTTHTGIKSSSAPLLAGGAHATGTPSRHTYNSTHSSAEPLDDLMEMDFTNRSDSSPAKVEIPPPSLPPSTTSRSNQLALSVPMPNPIVKKCPDNEGYMDMSPGNVSAGYVEMKPVELLNSVISVVKTNSDIARKVSIAKSPPTMSSEITQGLDSLHLSSQSSTPDGYVEMSWNIARAINTKLQNRNRISSLPIAINSNNPNPKDSKSQASLSASPIFNIASLLKEEVDNSETNVQRGTPPKGSPGVSPVTPVTPSPSSSLKRTKKHNTRRNSKELATPVGNQSQTIFPFHLNSPGSPMKPFSPKAPLAVSETMPGRKCPVDASSGTLKLSQLSCADNSEFNTTNLANSLESVSDYMEMVPGRLSTVREINESSLKSCVDKDMKQLINKATKVSGLAMPSDFDYINLNPTATLNKSKHQLMQQKSVDESSTHHQIYPLSNQPFLDLSFSTAKPPNGSQSIASSKLQNMPRKISMPAFSTNTSLIRNTDANAKENQGILSSNPLANKTLMSNPLTKSNINITNINQVQTVKKPILVISQTQSITANFKPITAGDMCEPRSTKSGSPKPVESVLNRQLAGTLFDNKCKGSKDCAEGYEILMSQNAQLQKLLYPSSVNNTKCKKGNGSGSRPPSVNSETGVAREVRSRPSSVSSELSGTPGGSRPNSVAGEREGGAVLGRLHYASLELDPPAERSPRPPTTPQAMAPAFTYAQIDFVKSEELKNSKNLVAKSKN